MIKNGKVRVCFRIGLDDGSHNVWCDMNFIPKDGSKIDVMSFLGDEFINGLSDKYKELLVAREGSWECNTPVLTRDDNGVYLDIYVWSLIY